MADSRAAEVLEGYDRLKGARGTWETHWQEVAERVWPTMAEMTGWRTGSRHRRVVVRREHPWAERRTPAALGAHGQEHPLH